MTVEEIIELIEVSTEIHLYDRDVNPLGMIPAIKEKNDEYTRETTDWIENKWLYSDTFLLKKLKKEYFIPLLKKEVYCISGGRAASVYIYI